MDFQSDAFSANHDSARSVFYTSARKLFHHVFSVLTPFIMNLHILWMQHKCFCSIKLFQNIGAQTWVLQIVDRVQDKLAAHVTLNVHDMLFMMCRVHKVCSSKTLVWWRFHIRFWIRLNLDNRYFVSSWLLFLFEKLFIYFSSLKYLPGWKYSLILMHPL